jgi:hypothetical protein
MKKTVFLIFSILFLIVTIILIKESKKIFVIIEKIIGQPINLNNNDVDLILGWNKQIDTEEKYFLLHKSENIISLNTYENNELNEIRFFKVLEKSLMATDKKERVVILDTSKNTITIYNIHSSNEMELLIPYNINPKTIFINDDNVFIGGAMRSTESLIQYHIKSDSWYKLDIPEEFTVFGKAIDDLVVNENYLIAIDNIVVPKYILFYHLNTTGKLLFSHFRELKHNGACEEIHYGRISTKYLGLFSNTHGLMTSEHITIYRDLNLTSSFSISIIRENNFNLINHFLIIQDTLYIAHKINGLGVFEIKDSYFAVSRDRYARFNYRVDENNVNYFQYANEEILRLTLIPNNNKFVLTIRNESGNIRYEIKEI